MLIIVAEPKMLRGKVAVVTGSTKGIGLGIAEVLAREAAFLVISGSRPKEDAQDSLIIIEKNYPEGLLLNIVEPSLILTLILRI